MGPPKTNHHRGKWRRYGGGSQEGRQDRRAARNTGFSVREPGQEPRACLPWPRGSGPLLPWHLRFFLPKWIMAVASTLEQRCRHEIRFPIALVQMKMTACDHCLSDSAHPKRHCPWCPCRRSLSHCNFSKSTLEGDCGEEQRDKRLDHVQEALIYEPSRCELSKTHTLCASP